MIAPTSETARTEEIFPQLLQPLSHRFRSAQPSGDGEFGSLKSALGGQTNEAENA